MALVLEPLKSARRDGDRSSDKQITGINLGLSLLDLEHALSDLSGIGDLHQFHTDDLDTGLSDALVHEITHCRANNGGIAHE